VAVDFVAAVTGTFTLATLLRAADAASVDLLGVGMPDVHVVLDRPRVDGRPASSGSRPSDAELEDVVLGPRAHDPRSLHVIDIVDARDRDLVLAVETPTTEDSRIVFVPRRDSTGIVLALVLAIGAAREGHGSVLDYDLRLTEPLLFDPDAIVAATRLDVPASSFDEAARIYLVSRGQLV
jgi:hypothetical protein